MNLNAIAGGVVSAISPPVVLKIQISTGPGKTGSDGGRSPTYADPVYAPGNLCPMSYTDIVQADGMQIQGVRSKLYINAQIEGLVRSKNRGGDLVTLPDGSVYKVALILEAWPNWTSCIVTLQDNA